MYSLLVSPDPEHWESDTAFMDRGRFLEHTTEHIIQARFRDVLTGKSINLQDLESIPALLGYEVGKGDFFRLAWLSDIQADKTRITFRITNDPGYKPIPSTLLQKNRKALDIDDLELHRYHWAVKDRNLQEFLKAHGIAKPNSPGDVFFAEAKKALSTNYFPDLNVRPVEHSIIEQPISAPPAQTSGAAIEAAAELAPHRARVFVVHGRDEGMKNTVSRYLEKIGLEAVILHEQPNAGRTVISKFIETARTCQFAVSLLAPEDIGGLDGETPQKHRARQNVVFELGFFIGLLGPANVVALVAGDVERPSDIEGVVYLSYKGSWKQELARELHQAGIYFDHKVALLQA